MKRTCLVACVTLIITPAYFYGVEDFNEPSGKSGDQPPPHEHEAGPRETPPPAQHLPKTGSAGNSHETENPFSGNMKAIGSFLHIDNLSYEYLNTRFAELGGETPLIYAVKTGNMNLITALLELKDPTSKLNSVALSTQDAHGKTALMYAIEMGKTEIVKLFLQRPYQATFVNLIDSHGHDALSIALKDLSGETRRNIVEMLIKGGAKPDAHDLRTILQQQGPTADTVSLIKLLVKYGADPNAVESDQPPLLFEALKTNNPELIKLFLEKGRIESLISWTLHNPHILDFKTLFQTIVASNYNPAIQALLKNTPIEQVDVTDTNGNTPLMIALQLGFYDSAIELIQNGANIDLKNLANKTARDFLPPSRGMRTQPRTSQQLKINMLQKLFETSFNDPSFEPLYVAFIRAAQRNDTDMMQKLITPLTAESPSNIKSIINISLAYAIENSATEAIILLKQNSAISKYSNLQSALVAAVRYNLNEVVSSLLKANVNPNTPVTAGPTPLIVAATQGNYALAKLLLDTGANPLLRDMDGQRAYQFVADKHSALYQMLLYPTIQGKTPEATNFLRAVVKGDINTVKDLLATNPKLVLSRETMSRNSALDFAITLNNKNMVQLLIQHNADITISNILNAIDNNSSDALEALIIGAQQRYGKNFHDFIDSTTKRGGSPLLLAANSGNLSIVKTILTAGANPDKENKDGSTALMIAAQAGNVDMVKALLLAGANPRIIDNRGYRADQLTTNKQIQELIREWL